MTRRTGSSEVVAEVFVAVEVFVAAEVFVGFEVFVAVEVFVAAEVLVVPFSLSGLVDLLSVFPAFSSDFSVLDSFFSVFLSSDF